MSARCLWVDISVILGFDWRSCAIFDWFDWYGSALPRASGRQGAVRRGRKRLDGAGASSPSWMPPTRYLPTTLQDGSPKLRARFDWPRDHFPRKIAQRRSRPTQRQMTKMTKASSPTSNVACGRPCRLERWSKSGGYFGGTPVVVAGVKSRGAFEQERTRGRASDMRHSPSRAGTSLQALGGWHADREISS